MPAPYVYPATRGSLFGKESFPSHSTGESYTDAGGFRERNSPLRVLFGRLRFPIRGGRFNGHIPSEQPTTRGGIAAGPPFFWRGVGHHQRGRNFFVARGSTETLSYQGSVKAVPGSHGSALGQRRRAAGANAARSESRSRALSLGDGDHRFYFGSSFRTIRRRGIRRDPQEVASPSLLNRLYP